MDGARTASRAILSVVLLLVTDSPATGHAVARRSAAYTVTPIAGGRELLVAARLDYMPRYLTMIASAPRTLDSGWAQFVREVELRTLDGRPVPLTWTGAGWTAATTGTLGPVDLRYRVVMRQDDTLPNGEPRWIRDRTMSEAAYVKEWGLFATGETVLVLPDSLDGATLEFRLPEAWAAATSWEAAGKPSLQHAFYAAGSYIPGMFTVGRISTDTTRVGNLLLQYAFGGTEIMSQAAAVESGVAQALAYFTRLFGAPPPGRGGQPLRKVFVMVSAETRRDFIGGGLTGTNISILQPPTNGRQGTQALVAHELFHLWNARAFRNASPAEAWFAEGVTEYYAYKALRSTGAISEIEWRANLADADRRYRADPGFRHLSIAEAGADKFHHQGLIYAGGELLGACLDQDLQQHTSSRLGLDDVMRAVGHQFNATDRRYDNASLARVVQAVSGLDYRPWFDDYITGILALPSNACGLAGNSPS